MAEAPAPHHALVMQFVAALLQRTLDCPTVAAHQQAPKLPGRPDALDQPCGSPNTSGAAVHRV